MELIRLTNWDVNTPIEPLNNTNCVFQTLHPKGSLVQRMHMEKKSSWKNIGVKPGKESILGCSAAQRRILEPSRDKWHLPQQVVFIRLIKLQL